MVDPENYEKPKNKNGTVMMVMMVGLAISTLVGLGALITAVVRPMAVQIESLERQLIAAVSTIHAQHAATFSRVEEQIRDHKGLYGHPEAHSAITAFVAALDEVEAQFDGDRALSAAARAAHERRFAKLEGWFEEDGRGIIGSNAAQWERIKAIERHVFNGMWKQGPGQAPGAD
jgi:hypothetical protein